MDPAVAALDLTKAGAIIASMIESYLAAGATPPNAEGAEHAEFENSRASSGAAGLHLHPSIVASASALQSGEHGTPVQSDQPSTITRLDSRADPNSRCGSRPLGRAGDQTRRLQGPCERFSYGANRRDLRAGIIPLSTIQQGLAPAFGTMRDHQNLGVEQEHVFWWCSQSRFLSVPRLTTCAGSMG